MAYTTIADPELYFQTELYTGTGSALSRTFDGTNDMQPDLIWIATRSTTENQPIYDSVRGTGKSLHSNDTDAEADEEGVSAFGSDGFSLGDHGGANQSSATHVAWCWKAGTTSGIAGSPSITPSSYSFNATPGFSIIAYTGNSTAGATLPHGLGVAPKMIFGKKVNGTDGWGVFHASMDATAPEDYNLFLNTAAARADSPMWNDTPPTSTLFSLGSGGDINSSSNTYIAYCFADVQGYSKFGGFTGNGNVDGTFVYLGFRPAFVMIKCATRSGTDIWTMYDNKRGQNVISNALSADTNAAERSSADIDFLSNGFKTRIATTDVNPSGETAIYMAFAEAPFCNSNGVPCNAR